MTPFLLLYTLAALLEAADVGNVPFIVTRQNAGDLFEPEGMQGACEPESCVGFSSGTAATDSGASNNCKCRCHPHLPAFREDLRICVDDIRECVLAPFVGGSTSQQIPFVFLPLKDQIIHPSKEISFAGIQTPVCAVSGAKFLTEAGWIDLRTPIDSDVPFRLFRDEGRTFLQWIGDPDLRNRMSGRLVLVYLMCRELADVPENPTLFSPCVAFRIVGSPFKFPNNVSEVAFSPDPQTGTDSGHLSVSEYVAIGICSVLLGLIYVASVFLYLHLKKRTRHANEKNRPEANMGDLEEGIVKNNPLLGMSAHFQPQDGNFSDSTSSDNDTTPDILQHHDDRKKTTTSAIVHSQYQRNFHYNSILPLEINHQESSIEKLPEENVSIVETLEGKEDRMESFKAITGPVRKKLYFNPAYFEPQLLLTPPPAAIEFLTKIREVITIAKQKMAAKRFAPSLMGIPEEDSTHHSDTIPEYAKSNISRRSSAISLKRENSRRKTCSGCPGCEPQDFRQLCGKLPEFPALGACHNCVTSANESKQRSIRKWLEDVPVLDENLNRKSNKRLRSPTRSLPPDGISSPIRTLSPRPASERGFSPDRIKPKKFITKPKAPTPQPIKPEEHQYDVIDNKKMNFPPPDMIHEAMAVDIKSEGLTRMPTLTKQQMKAVIEEFTVQRSIIIADNPDNHKKPAPIDYEADSLERSPTVQKGYSTPTEYAEVSSSQPSPSLSSALPMDEEVTMRNAVFNTKTGNMTISKLNIDEILQQEDEEDNYELIVLKKNSLKKQDFFKLPELLQRTNGYSLVSEVYVNNGYNYNSTPSSPSNSNSSTLDKKALKMKQNNNEPGKLLIEVQDCADHYIPVEDSDSFEPDTLDRKPSKNHIARSKTEDSEYVDSLERPNQIQLKSKGSFRKETSPVPVQPSNFTRVFGSLREIYEAKTKGLLKTNISTDEGKMLTLEERHSKRQRDNNVVPPDVIPPPPHDTSPIYEHPKPPRKVVVEGENTSVRPPLPPKNAGCRRSQRFGGAQKRTWRRLVDLQRKTEDSGYLSTDSNDTSLPKGRKLSPDGGSESDGSVGDGQSESGAESVETHSVFFDNCRKPSAYTSFGSLDSGVDTGRCTTVAYGTAVDDCQSSDSEPVSYKTVVPLNNGRRAAVKIDNEPG